MNKATVVTGRLVIDYTFDKAISFGVGDTIELTVNLDPPEPPTPKLPWWRFW